MAIICSDARAFHNYQSKYPHIPFALTEQPRRLASLLARHLYSPALHHLTCFAVTGTKGKTTVTHWLHETLNRTHRPAARVGTLGADPPLMDDTGLTTPEGPDLGAYVLQIVSRGIRFLTIEASSIGLDQFRLDALTVHTAAFTNLGHDHLDYHHSMEAYFLAKKRLFEADHWHLKTAVIHVDDPFGKRLADTISSEVQILRIGHSSDPTLDYSIELEVCKINDVRGYLKGRRLPKPLPFRLRRGGSPYADNFLTTFAILSEFFAPSELQDLIEIMEQFAGVPGRFELYESKDGIQVIIDYAHTPESLAAVLELIRQSKPAQIFIVFGCGGERDRKKRPRMGSVAASVADRIFLTDDNPRHEDPKRIVSDILSGISPGDFNKVEIIHDRSQAIRTALQEASPGTVVLIAGKGHETYQIYGEKKIHHSDQEIVNQWLQSE